jgi:hypothetical protein
LNACVVHFIIVFYRRIFGGEGVLIESSCPILLSEKTFLLSEFFPAKFFFCSERFPFSKITEKILAGKKLTEQSFLHRLIFELKAS